MRRLSLLILLSSALIVWTGCSEVKRKAEDAARGTINRAVDSKIEEGKEGADKAIENGSDSSDTKNKKKIKGDQKDSDE